MILSKGVEDKAIESEDSTTIRMCKIIESHSYSDPQSMGDNDAYLAANIYKR
jgi:uncharacterized protein YciI